MLRSRYKDRKKERKLADNLNIGASHLEKLAKYYMNVLLRTALINSVLVYCRGISLRTGMTIMDPY